MSLMRFYYDPFSEFDRLFDDAFSSHFLRPIAGQSLTETRDIFRRSSIAPISLRTWTDSMDAG